MGETIKQRDYMFDAFRGVLMLSIPLSHFTKQSANIYQAMYAGHGFTQDSLCGFVYITINVFVMQAFMFLSGYFSKKPEKARATAFKGVLWPYLVFTTIDLIAAWAFDVPIGHYFSYLTPPFALWFLLALFFYRFFLPVIAQFRYALTFSIVVFFIAGLLPFGQFMALGRVFSYFTFFMIGFYCSKERLDWVRQLKKKKTVLVLLAAALVYVSYWLTQHGPRLSWFLLKQSCDHFGMAWYDDIKWRAVVFVLACGWIVLMVNILPSKKNILCHVGTNTMPVYIFHLGIRFVIAKMGVMVGLVSSLIAAWFAVISLLHMKHKNWTISTVLTVLSIAGIVVMAKTHCITPLIGVCPGNIVLFYIVTFGSALIAGFSFSAPFWAKLYDLVTEGPARDSILTKWMVMKKEEPEEK